MSDPICKLLDAIISSAQSPESGEETASIRDLKRLSAQIKDSETRHEELEMKAKTALQTYISTLFTETD